MEWTYNIMKIKKDNIAGRYGVEIDLDINNFDEQELGNLLAEQLIVVFKPENKSTNAENAKMLWHFAKNFGNIQTWDKNVTKATGNNVPNNATSYCDDNGMIVYPGIDRVTRKKDKDGKFTGGIGGISKRLNWHCNEFSLQKPQFPVVALHGVSHSSPSITQVCPMVEQYEMLDNDTQAWMETLNVVWDPRIGDTNFKEDKTAPDLNGEQIDYLWEGNQLELKKYNQDANPVDIKPLIKTSNAGIKGIHFSPGQCKGIEGMSMKEFEEFRQDIIFPMLNEKYWYNTVWEDGTILLMDQTVTIHRRVALNGKVDDFTTNYLEKRLLHRIEFDFENISGIPAKV